jgi:hypothetical protein
MYRSHKPILLAAVALACSGSVQAATPAPGATATSTAKADASSNERLLKAMDVASTWGHPDLFGEFAGMRHYAKGDYKTAIKYFKYGARYADKPSQLALGVMYASGLGVDKDAVTGCAWLILAASRKYPRYVATRDKFCGELDPAQHDRVGAVLADLRPEYGDQVARKRMAHELRIARSQRTGSRVGFDFGATSHAGASMSGFNAATVAGAAGSACTSSITVDGIPWPTDGCVGRDFWSPDRWDPKTYFALRDAHWNGTVTVGALEKQSQAHAAADATEPSQAAPAAGSSTEH